MRAAVLMKHGGPEALDVVDDLPVPEPGPGEVRLRMRAAALNRHDIWVRGEGAGLIFLFLTSSQQTVLV